MTEQTSQTLRPNPLKAVFKRIWVVIVGVVAVAIFFLWPVLSNSPVDYANIDDHFKYGSIGSEPVNGIPYWIWKVLPEVFPDKLPGKPEFDVKTRLKSRQSKLCINTGLFRLMSIIFNK